MRPKNTQIQWSLLLNQWNSCFRCTCPLQTPCASFRSKWTAHHLGAPWSAPGKDYKIWRSYEWENHLLRNRAQSHRPETDPRHRILICGKWWSTWWIHSEFFNLPMISMFAMWTAGKKLGDLHNSFLGCCFDKWRKIWQQSVKEAHS